MSSLRLVGSSPKRNSGVLLRPLAGHSNFVGGLVAMPDHPQFRRHPLVSASDDHAIKVWDTKDWSVVRTIKGHTNYVSRVALTPNDGLISCGKDGTVRIWDMPTGREFACFDWGGRWITEIAISPDGNTAVCSSIDNVMKVYDVERGQEVRTRAPDGTRVVSRRSC